MLRKRFNSSDYRTRNAQNYCMPKRLQLYEPSFVPTVIHEWNLLPSGVRQIDSIRTFKEKISVNNEDIVTSNSAPLLITYDDILKLFTRDFDPTVHPIMINIDVIIINSSLCSCGKPEDTYHHFFKCVHEDIRNALFNEIFQRGIVPFPIILPV